MDKKTVDEAARLEVDGFVCKGAKPRLMEEALAAVLDGKKCIDPSVQGELAAGKTFEGYPRAGSA